jgi:hypothetical protein
MMMRGSWHWSGLLTPGALACIAALLIALNGILPDPIERVVDDALVAIVSVCGLFKAVV